MKKLSYFKLSEEIVDVLVAKTQSPNRHFFRILVAYYLSKVASMMRCNVETKDRGVIPVNTYVLNLMPSGAGKGHSTNIMEELIIAEFKEEFLEKIFPIKAHQYIAQLANTEALRTGEDVDVCVEKLVKEFESTGELLFSFDSGTAPATKQMRHKLLLANAGSMNLEMDEVGSNIQGNSEMLNTFLELYDVGKVKQKLIKSTTENKRNTDLDGRTPTNMMLFGTPTKLLDGGKIEEDFMTMLETGYARRLLFGFEHYSATISELTPEEQFDNLVDPKQDITIKKISSHIRNLAQNSEFNRILHIDRTNSIMLLAYKTRCEKRAFKLKNHQDVAKAELAHRYYKALKLAGAYAFAEGMHDIGKEHLEAAIQLVEDSGEHFNLIMTRKGNHERLAEYIADVGEEITQVDLVNELPFYKGTKDQKNELMKLAIAYGYTHNIVIRRTEIDGIDFFSGESLKRTNLDKMHIAYSQDITSNYKGDTSAFGKLHQLVSTPGYHYTAHSFIDGHRKGENAIPGFDLVILDVDGDIQMETTELLLEDYEYLIATTKRHTTEKNRFRIILPLSHYLKLSPIDYSQFMNNVFTWLPFDVDSQTKDAARKWMSHGGEYHYNKGKLIDATKFIPKTRKAENYVKSVIKAGSISNLERWFLANTKMGNRQNMMYRLGCVYIELGANMSELDNLMLAFNNKLELPLPESELRSQVNAALQSKLQRKGE
jgi:hypothetical protein